jgi:hypothetical protein
MEIIMHKMHVEIQRLENASKSSVAEKLKRLVIRKKSPSVEPVPPPLIAFQAEGHKSGGNSPQMVTKTEHHDHDKNGHHHHHHHHHQVKHELEVKTDHSEQSTHSEENPPPRATSFDIPMFGEVK